MKKNLVKILYITRIILFILHMLMLFMILNSIIGINLVGYLFLLVDIIFIGRNIIELLSQKKRYQNDWYYNIMQCGLFGYIVILWVRLYWHTTIFSTEMIHYLQINYIILMILQIFLIVYSVFLIDRNIFNYWKK